MSEIICPHCNQQITIPSEPAPSRELLRISEARNILFDKMHKPFCRETLIKIIQEGTLEGRKIGDMWFIYADSFDVWVRSLDEPAHYRKAA